MWGRDNHRAEGGGLLRRPQQQTEQEVMEVLTRLEQRRKSARLEFKISSEAYVKGLSENY